MSDVKVKLKRINSNICIERARGALKLNLDRRPTASNSASVSRPSSTLPRTALEPALISTVVYRISPVHPVDHPESDCFLGQPPRRCLGDVAATSLFDSLLEACDDHPRGLCDLSHFPQRSSRRAQRNGSPRIDLGVLVSLSLPTTLIFLDSKQSTPLQSSSTVLLPACA